LILEKFVEDELNCSVITGNKNSGSEQKKEKKENKV